ncbi:MAG: hypothetical protein JW840_00150 [Candidatus Thermoplasmatota archaeon]|nr:hypothetical protein [Candidatus Thermoplasmatota archaeon]
MESDNTADISQRNRWLLYGVAALACSVVFYFLERIILVGFGFILGVLFYFVALLIFVLAIYYFDDAYKGLKIVGIIGLLLFLFIFVRI